MRNSHNERAVHEYRRDKSCKWVSVQRSCIVLWSEFPKIQVTAEVFGLFLFHFWCQACPVHAQSSGSLWIQSVWLMHTQPCYLKYCNFWRVAGTESWSEIEQSSLLGKSMLFYVWYGTMAGTSNVHHKHSSLTMQSTTALPCRQRCLDWAVLFLGIDGKSWCSVSEIIFAYRVIQVKGANFIQLTKNYYKSCF